MEVLRIKNEKLEAIRGFAAAYVVIHHFFGFTELGEVAAVLRFPFRFGQEAVILFFLLSGFVISLAFENTRDKSLPTYVNKRVTRIFPLFLFSLGLSIVFNTLNGDELTKGDYTNLVGNLFMLQGAGRGAIVAPFLENHALWSLSYEWWFYVLFFPLTFLFSKIKHHTPTSSLYYVLLASVVAWFLYLYRPSHLLLVVSYLILWWAGVYIAHVYRATGKVTFRSLLPVYVCLLVMVAATALPIFFAYAEGLRDFRAISYPVITWRHFTFAFLAIGAANAWSVVRFAGFRFFTPFAKLASISYGLYCLHFPILLLEIPAIKNVYVLLLVKLVLIVALSWLAEIVLQPVFNRLGSKISRQRKPAPATPVLYQPIVSEQASPADLPQIIAQPSLNKALAPEVVEG